MNSRTLARTTCSNNMDAFGKAKAADLSDTATDSDGRKKAKAKARSKFGDLTVLTGSIATQVAKQQSGGSAIGTTSRGVLRDALTGDLREWNRTAAAVAEDLKRPEIMDGFRMPHGNNDTELAGTARAFIKSVEALALHDAFVEHGLEDDFEDALDERITEFEDSQDTQSTAGQQSSGATDALDELIRTGMSIRKGLDALVHNLFKGNTFSKATPPSSANGPPPATSSARAPARRSLRRAARPRRHQNRKVHATILAVAMRRRQ